MLSLKLITTDQEYENLVAISLVLSRGKRLSCNAFGCDGSLAKHYTFDEAFLSTSDLEIIYRGAETTDNSQCVGAVEKKLEEMISQGFDELHQGHAPHRVNEIQSDDGKRGLVQSLQMTVDGGEEIEIGDLSSIPYARLSVVLCGGGQSALTIAQGYKNDLNKQITWLKDKRDSSFKLMVRLVS